MPEMSSRSPSIASSAVSRIASGSIGLPRWTNSPLRQRVLLEHVLDRLQVELGGHVAHREVLVVEPLGRVGAFLVADGEMLEHLVVAQHVALDVHRQEPGELQEARVDLASPARVA
jgi:hypothetical protein